MIKKNKLAIVGMGNVGSAVLARAVAFELAPEIVCIDINEAKAWGEARDAAHSTPCNFCPNIKVYAGGFEECRDASVIVIAAGPSIMPGKKLERLLLAEQNIAVINDVMANITKYTKDAIIIMITNPLDITTYLAATAFGYPKGKIFGTGTTLETLRFKRIIADHYDVDAKDVQGYILGEHGNSAFAAWSSVTVGSIPLADLDEFLAKDAPLDFEATAHEVVQTAHDVLNAKGWTNTGIAMGVCRIIKAIFYDEHSILPVSMPLNGEYGLSDVSLSLPSLITADGVTKRFAIKLSESELEKLKNSASTVKEVLRSNSLIK
jgi:L-lactate dehydrogenase